MKDVRVMQEESAKSLATYTGMSLDSFRSVESAARETYLADATNVFVAVLFREAKVLVQAEADIVAVEAVRS